MQDDMNISSSQELTLSQENFSEIFTDNQQLNMLSNEDICAILENWDNNDGDEATEQNMNPRTAKYKSPMLSAMPASFSKGPRVTRVVPIIPSSSVAPETSLPSTAKSCLPATNNWQGECGFDIIFDTPKEKKGTEKKVAWSYSQERDKLYVTKGMPCPIKFTANVRSLNLSSSLQLRVQAIFSHPEYSNEIVKRCINHIVHDEKAGIPYTNFLVKCECDEAEYVIDGSTNQFSVVVPFQSPQTGQNFSSYIFKFTCFSSCSGGLNRRPIMVLFTLERRGKVIGRRSVPIKICACPGRDCKNDDKLMADTKKEKKESSKKRKAENDPLPYMSEVSAFFNKMSESVKKSNHSPNKDGLYTITVQDKDLYDFLRQAKHLYELNKTMNQLSPESAFLLKGLFKKVKTECDTDASD